MVAGEIQVLILFPAVEHASGWEELGLLRMKVEVLDRHYAALAVVTLQIRTTSSLGAEVHFLERNGEWVLQWVVPVVTAAL